MIGHVLQMVNIPVPGLSKDPFVLDFPGNELPFYEAVPLPKVAKKRTWDARDLPEDSQQCVHMWWDRDAEHKITGHQRCVNLSVKAGPNGWLCREHQGILRSRRVTLPQTFMRVEEVIIQTETRAIGRSELELAGVGRATILCVKGLRMTYPPEAFLSPDIDTEN